jgi:AcrR family transcriptional regulator
MAKTTDDTTEATMDPSLGEGDASWRDRALERSLRTAKAKAMSRSDKFIATAMEILQETGRTDFTVQELVDRSKTSLRSFYQYFSGKDELLLALLEESIAQSVAAWREKIDGLDTMAALKTVVSSIYDGDGVGVGSLNRGMAPYHVGLADSHSTDYQRAISPMARVIHELVDRGVAEGSIRSDIPADKLTVVFIQSVIGSTLFTALSKTAQERKADGETMWAFLSPGLTGGK